MAQRYELNKTQKLAFCSALKKVREASKQYVDQYGLDVYEDMINRAKLSSAVGYLDHIYQLTGLEGDHLIRDLIQEFKDPRFEQYDVAQRMTIMR